MLLFLDERKLLKRKNLPSLMPDEDNNFDNSLVLEFRKWWRHAQPKNSAVANMMDLIFLKEVENMYHVSIEL